jgi:hypothetical protein
MDRSLDLSGVPLGRLLYALQLVVLALVVAFVAFPLDGPASVALAVLFGGLVVVTVYGLWRSTTGDGDSAHLGTAADITYDPVADPGQAAKERWQKAVQRLPGGDDEQD